MTEGNDNGSNLVRVRAQVMMRDDSTGGWVPMGGGGLSNVSVFKRISHPDIDNIKHEYLIYGKRISDQSVVFSCVIKRDFQYNIVMPTFHHWKTGDHKFGLTFQTAADARAFDKGVKCAIDDLLDGLNEMPQRYGRPVEAGDNDVFMQVVLPRVERDGSISSSGSSSTTITSSSTRTPTTTVSLSTPDHLHHHATAKTALTAPDLQLHLHHRHLLHHTHHHLPHSSGPSTPVCISTTNTSPSSTVSNPTTIGSLPPPRHRMGHIPREKHIPSPVNGSDKPGMDVTKSEQEKNQDFGESYYVQFGNKERPVPPPPLHEYSYPMMGAPKSDRRDSIASIKKQQQLELVGKTDTSMISRTIHVKRSKKKTRWDRLSRARCKYCNDSFSEEFNTRGSCEYSPDYVKDVIDKVTCIQCTKCILYHCMRNAEGEFPSHPCECEETEERCSKRYICLTILSLFLPCMWCYLPMRACHRCAVSCGMCGGKHEAS